MPLSTVDPPKHGAVERPKVSYYSRALRGKKSVGDATASTIAGAPAGAVASTAAPSTPAPSTPATSTAAPGTPATSAPAARPVASSTAAASTAPAGAAASMTASSAAAVDGRPSSMAAAGAIAGETAAAARSAASAPSRVSAQDAAGAQCATSGYPARSSCGAGGGSLSSSPCAEAASSVAWKPSLRMPSTSTSSIKTAPASRRPTEATQRSVPLADEVDSASALGKEPALPSFASVTHAITVQGPAQALAMLIGKKLVENRSWRIPAGWYALHVGGQRASEWGLRALEICPDLPPEEELEDMFGAIVGLLYLTEQRSVADCHGYAWAFGPICHVVTAAVRLKTPVRQRGHPGLWLLPQDTRQQVVAQLSAGLRAQRHDLTALGRPVANASATSSTSVVGTGARSGGGRGPPNLGRARGPT